MCLSVLYKLLTKNNCEQFTNTLHEKQRNNKWPERLPGRDARKQRVNCNWRDYNWPSYKQAKQFEHDIPWLQKGIWFNAAWLVGKGFANIKSQSPNNWVFRARYGPMEGCAGKLCGGKETSNRIQIRRGIFQDDALSPLYQLKSRHIDIGINHLIYMDNIKPYSPKKDKLHKVVKMIHEFSSRIEKEFAWGKRKVVNIRKVWMKKARNIWGFFNWKV